jgi:hypothetical protein
VSSGNPGDGLTDRPKMAEALASLKEGLSETDDPLYDGWKLRKGAGAEADNLAAAGEAAHPDATDTVPVRVVRYLVFPKWALVAAGALVAFAAIVTVVRVGFRRNAAPSSAASAVATESPTVAQSEPTPSLPAYPKAAESGAPAVVATVHAPVPRRVKDKKAKTQAPGFFHDPGF